MENKFYPPKKEKKNVCFALLQNTGLGWVKVRPQRVNSNTTYTLKRTEVLQNAVLWHVVGKSCEGSVINMYLNLSDFLRCANSFCIEPLNLGNITPIKSADNI